MGAFCGDVQMLPEPRPPSSRSQFPSEHRRCWVAGTWDFPASHRGGQIPVGGCGERGRAETLRTEGLEGQQRTDSSGTDTHTGSGTQICNGGWRTWGVQGLPDATTQALREPRKGGVLCCKAPPVITPLSTVRTAATQGPLPGPDPFTKATWDPHEKQGVTPAKQLCAATLVGTVGRNSGICCSAPPAQRQRLQAGLSGLHTLEEKLGGAAGLRNWLEELATHCRCTQSSRRY